MTADWRAQPERGSPFALAAIRWIAMCIGRPVARALLYPITLYFLLTSRAARRASRQFLERAGVHGAHLGHVFGHLHTFAAVILDRLYLLGGELGRFDIRMHLDPRSDAALGDGRPALLLGSHLGSFDAVRSLALTGRRVRLRALMRHEHNELVTRILERLDPAIAESIIPIGRPESLLRTKEWVEQGGTVALLGDRVSTDDIGERRRAVPCTFMGAEAELPSAPIRLAASLGVPVMLFFGIYRGGNRYDVYIEWFADGQELGRDATGEALAAEVQRYAGRLEAFARDAPYNWFNFYDFWGDFPAGDALKRRAAGDSHRYPARERIR